MQISEHQYYLMLEENKRMSKQFIVNRHTTPSTPTLDEVPNEKIRVFKNEATIDAALSSLDENEIVATEDGAESSTRIGNPLGTILAIHSNAVPYGYLPCNGVAFDEHQYPALYAMLGDNHTPYSYDKSRLGDYESITISTDANNPTVMQFDGFITLQSASAILQLRVLDNPALGTAPNVYTVYSNTSTNFATGTFPLRKGDRFYIDTGVVQNSAVRYYKHFNVIKATSGLEETQQDYVLQSLLEADNYSTDEVATGKKWIDGKTIYRKVIQGTFANGTVLLSNVDMMTFCYGLTGGDMLPKEGTGFFYKVRLNTTAHTIYVDASSTVDYMIVVEYTKN